MGLYQNVPHTVTQIGREGWEEVLRILYLGCREHPGIVFKALPPTQPPPHHMLSLHTPQPLPLPLLAGCNPTCTLESPGKLEKQCQYSNHTPNQASQLALPRTQALAVVVVFE